MKRIGVLGMGIEGTSLVRFLESRRIRDLKTYDEKQSEFLDFSNFSDRDVLFRSPGISPKHPALQKFSGKIMSGVDLFLQLCPTKKVIGVTGTKGKGSVSTLIFRIFEEANDTVFLVGNGGIPFFDHLAQMRTRDVVVTELSSFQLWDCHSSPQIAVLLRMSEDHLEVHGNLPNYLDAKKNIFLHQKSGGRVVYNADCPLVQEMIQDIPASHRIPFSRETEHPVGAFLRGKNIVWRSEEGGEEVLLSTDDILLRGPHHEENILAAISAAKLLNVRTLPLTTALAKFQGLPFRQEYLGKTAAGVSFYNDSYATNPGATVAALSSFPDPIVLIVGGSSKKTNYLPLAEKIVSSSVKTLLATGETGKEIADLVQKLHFSGKILFPKNHQECKALFPTITSPGDLVLFSPASASFDQFLNATERGKSWSTMVKEYLREQEESILSSSRG